MLSYSCESLALFYHAGEKWYQLLCISYRLIYTVSTDTELCPESQVQNLISALLILGKITLLISRTNQLGKMHITLPPNQKYYLVLDQGRIQIKKKKHCQ